MFEILLASGMNRKKLEFLGRIPTGQFISGVALADEGQYAAGQSLWGDSDWMKFNDGGIIKYIPVKTFRQNVSYVSMTAANITNGAKTIRVKDKFYSLRLMTGTDTVNSEWDRLMNSISVDRVARYTGPIFANYTKYDLGMTQFEDGRNTLCYSENGMSPRRIVGDDNLYLVDHTTRYNYHGWRPLMEELKPLLYLGEVAPDSLISGSALAQLAGLTVGTAIHDDSGWLHFRDVDGKEKFVAKKQYRYGVSRSQLDEVGLLNGKPITIDGVNYIVRCLTGSNTANISLSTGPEYDNIFFKHSEWTRLLYTVASSRPSGYDGPVFAAFSNTDLGFDQTNGYLNSCIGNSSTNTANGVFRGVNDVTYAQITANSTVSSNRGWRPVLEKV